MRRVLELTEPRNGRRGYNVEAGWSRKLTNRRVRHRSREMITHQRYDDAPPAPKTGGRVTW